MMEAVSSLIRQVIDRCWATPSDGVVNISVWEAEALNLQQMALGGEYISWKAPDCVVRFCGHDIKLVVKLSDPVAVAYGVAHDR